MSSDRVRAGSVSPGGIEDDLALAHLLADAADEITRAAFVAGETLEHEMKEDGTPVSAVDEAVEQRLLDMVRGHRPGDAVLGEEIGAHGRGNRRWVIDGIDGTNNFVAGSPLWGTLIALADGDAPILGVNTGPAQGRRWWAARHRGAWVGQHGAAAGERLSVAEPSAGGRLTACIAPRWEAHPRAAAIERLVERVDLVPATTHAGLMVAAGDIDLALHLDGGPWDFAGVMPIVWEAGGGCLDLDGHDVDLPRPPIIYVGSMTPETARGLSSG